MIPVPFTIGVHAWAPTGVRDAHGNNVPAWAPPVPVPVHGIAPTPRGPGEPFEPNRSVIVEGLTVYAPAGTVVGRHDRIEWPFPGGIIYEVDGDVADWTNGPWVNPAAGVVINMNRVEG